MSQADSEPITAETFAAFATWLGTPLPDDPIRAIRILRREAAAEIERLITMLDALGGDPDLEPTLGYVAPGHVDEAEIEEDPEPSLGWTGIINQASRNRLGDSDGQDYEKDDADKEDSDPGEDAGDFEPWLGSYNVIPGRSMADGSASWPDQVQVMDSGFDQSGWAYGGTDDLEDEHDGREDGGDREPDADAEPDHDNEGTERIPGGGP